MSSIFHTFTLSTAPVAAGDVRVDGAVQVDGFGVRAIDLVVLEDGLLVDVALLLALLLLTLLLIG